MPTTKKVDSEQKKVLTLYGERAWDNSLEDDSVARGYTSMNGYVHALARKITIYSVNYSTGLMPESADPKRKLEHRLWPFATILYSVELDLVQEYRPNDWAGQPLRKGETAFRVPL